MENDSMTNLTPIIMESLISIMIEYPLFNYPVITVFSMMKTSSPANILFRCNLISIISNCHY
jgi:hypothetical protein